MWANGENSGPKPVKKGGKIMTNYPFHGMRHYVLTKWNSSIPVEVSKRN